ncbi:hypothetical protein [Streptomyces sp. S186]|uniref:hypothetical protein n=1 Tax=Streptomyces sp. S186 TaxID=3434395 RepID=UPI003F664E26
MTSTSPGDGTDGPPLPPPGAGRSARRSRGRVWLGGLTWLMVALISATACYVVFAVVLPTDAKLYRDYATAKHCRAHAPEEGWEDCLRTVPFTVERTRVDHGMRNSTFEATLSGAPFWNGVVRFRGEEPLLAHLRPGEQVSGTVWRGDIVAVGKGSLRQATSREPGYDPQLTAALGTFTGLLAAQGLGFGAVRLVRRRGHEPFTWLPYGRALFSVMALTCAAVGVPGWWLGFAWWVIPVVAVPVAALSARWLYRLWRPHRRPTAVETPNQGGGPFRYGTELS